MKTTLKFALLFVVSNCFSQSSLTNGQVYNFSIGDVFQTTFISYLTTDPTVYTSSTILSKSFSSANDTIFIRLKKIFMFNPEATPAQQ